MDSYTQSAIKRKQYSPEFKANDVSPKKAAAFFAKE